MNGSSSQINKFLGRKLDKIESNHPIPAKFLPWNWKGILRKQHSAARDKNFGFRELFLFYILAQTIQKRPANGCATWFSTQVKDGTNQERFEMAFVLTMAAILGCDMSSHRQEFPRFLDKYYIYYTYIIYIYYIIIKGYRPCRRPPLSDWNPCEELHLFTMKTTTCGVKQGLWKCWPPAKWGQNEMGGLPKRGRFKTFEIL